MFPLLSPAQLERRARVYAMAGLFGLIGCVLAVALHTPCGVLTSFAAVFLMATWGTLQSYRTERGLWLIAALILLFGIPMWVLFVLADLVPRLRGTIAMPWPLALDAAGCTILWGECVRVAASAGMHNLRTVRPRLPRLTPWS